MQFSSITMLPCMHASRSRLPAAFSRRWLSDVLCFPLDEPTITTNSIRSWRACLIILRKKIKLSKRMGYFHRTALVTY
jgi:hypothetical protein